ncbi:helix-turn-helix domain-containing protein [Burkholderia vietnamiensis]|uniref:helix-turn-helix domain-containing protein n=1 Tax=Burkholderia vietnamiensis TaxID=60552 RepID=UPI00158B6F64|nr:helix-turn-helix domain-containing protein [Burkholderia vietnamiensis]
MNQQESAQTSRGVLSVNDFCHWAGIGRTAVYAEMKAGRLSARKFGRRTIIPQVEAERWLASLPMQRNS